MSAQRGRDSARDVLLNDEHIGKFAVVIVGPDADAAFGIDKLRRDA